MSFRREATVNQNQRRRKWNLPKWVNTGYLKSRFNMINWMKDIVSLFLIISANSWFPLINFVENDFLNIQIRIRKKKNYLLLYSDILSFNCCSKCSIFSQNLAQCVNFQWNWRLDERYSLRGCYAQRKETEEEISSAELELRYGQAQRCRVLINVFEIWQLWRCTGKDSCWLSSVSMTLPWEKR